MELKDQILAKMQQNKLDRAAHQEQVEGLDRGLIYLQGQLDLVESILKAEAERLKAGAASVVNEVVDEAKKLEGEVKEALSASNDSSPAPEAPAASSDASEASPAAVSGSDDDAPAIA